jgi:carbonic anhydrase/acetyltransferase-like protein (isoleucine patch superfamily)
VIKKVIRTVWGLLPASQAKNRLGRRLGYEVHASASVGPILLVNVMNLSVGADSRVGPFSVIRDMRRVSLGSGARLGQWNWISSARDFWHVDGAGELVISDGAAVTSRHYFDCSGGVAIGRFSTVAGVRSTFVTHGIDVGTNAQMCTGIVVDEYSIVGSNAKLVPGAFVPDHCLMAMGSVITVGLEEPYAMYAGSPARRKKGLDRNSAYFTRTVARVAVPARSSTLG